MNEPEVLLKLRRKYTKDEEVQWLIQEERNKYINQGILVGEQKSYIHELEDLLAQSKKQLADNIAGYIRQIKALQAKNDSLAGKNKNLNDRYNALLNNDENRKEVEQIKALNKKISELRQTIGTLVSKQKT